MYRSSCAIEIKATNKNTIPEKALQPHQKQALLDATGPGIVHKIADSKRRNPFDAFMLVNTNAFVVACFVNKGVCLVIPVKEWSGANIKTKAEYIIHL